MAPSVNARKASGGAIMKTVIGAGLIGLLFVGPAYADDLIPSWVTKEKLAGLKTIGIDTESDLQAKGNYHWRFRARKASAINVYSCPIGSIVAISRTIDPGRVLIDRA